MPFRSILRAVATCGLLLCWAPASADAPAPEHASLLAPPAAESVAAPAACRVPPDLLQPDEILPRLAAALHGGNELDVLALGSGMMLGPNGRMEESFPYLMAEVLEAAVPGLKVRLAMTVAKGLTAEEMLAALHDELADGRYGLVLWQTGTVEAVRRVPPDAFRKTLADGAAAIRLAGGELVLIDPPYAPELRARAHLDPYLDAMREAEKATGVVLFRRYDVMRRWAQSGQFNPEHASLAARGDTLDELHECLANALARLVLNAGGQPLP